MVKILRNHVFEIRNKELIYTRGRYREGKIILDKRIRESIDSNINLSLDNIIDGIKFPRLTIRNCKLVLPFKDIRWKKIEIPLLEASNRELVIKNKLLYKLGFDPESENINFTSEGICEAKMEDIGFWIIKKDLVNKYINLFKSKGIRLGSIDIDTNCIRKFLLHDQELNSSYRLKKLDYIVVSLDDFDLTVAYFYESKLEDIRQVNLLDYGNNTEIGEGIYDRIIKIKDGESVSKLREIKSVIRPALESIDWLPDLLILTGDFFSIPDIENYMSYEFNIQTILYRRSNIVGGLDIQDSIVALGGLITDEKFRF